MKKLFGFVRYFIVATLVFVMTFTSLEMTAFAYDSGKENTYYVEDTCVNPLVENDGDTFTVNGSYTTNVKYDAYDEMTEAALKVRDNMLARNTAFTVNINTTRSDVTNFVAEIFDLAISKEFADTSTAGDYLAWQYGGYSYTGNATVKNGVYQFTLNFKVNYYTTAAQETMVTQAVEAALDTLNLEGKDDYNKVKSIYDFVCKTCNYDNSKTNDTTKFTAYAAIIKKTAVCQGYTTLLYRMLEEAGFDTKIVTSDEHAWNIVKIGDRYYNVDVTWDDAYFDKGLAYNYFLKCNEHFADHTRQAEYTTKAFNAKYPMGDKCYAEVIGVTNQATANTAKSYTTTINGVTAVANGFTVKWNKVADATGYQVQYATKADFTGATTVNGGGTNTTTYTVTGRTSGTKYYVRVRTYITLIDGNRIYGAWTDAKTVTTPTAPAKVTVNSVAQLGTGFKANWKKVADVAGYQIQYATKADFTGATTVYAGDANAVSKSITGKAANTKYYVRVRAYKNVTGGAVYGAWSDAKTVTTPAKPNTVTMKTVNALSKGFTVNWNKVAGVTGYQIQYATKADFTGATTVDGGNANAVSKKITGKGANTKYYVRVRAYKNVGGVDVYGSWSAAKTVTTNK